MCAGPQEQHGQSRCHVQGVQPGDQETLEASGNMIPSNQGLNFQKDLETRIFEHYISVAAVREDDQGHRQGRAQTLQQDAYALYGLNEQSIQAIDHAIKGCVMI